MAYRTTLKQNVILHISDNQLVYLRKENKKYLFSLNDEVLCLAPYTKYVICPDVTMWIYPKKRGNRKNVNIYIEAPQSIQFLKQQ